MKTPFPGMDPYLEHPVLWEGFHARLIMATANQLQPQLDPRYVASVEERVFILEVEELELRQKRIEILDLYNGQKLVTVIEVLSPTNKQPGPGRESYAKKQCEILASQAHLVEIDLLREGNRLLSIPKRRLSALDPFCYIACVNRWPQRQRFELYARNLQDRLPRVRIPLAEPDPDVRLDLQAAVEQAYVDGRYWRRIRYDEPCIPPLSAEDQQWATAQWQSFRSTEGHRPPSPNGPTE